MYSISFVLNRKLIPKPETPRKSNAPQGEPETPRKSNGTAGRQRDQTAATKKDDSDDKNI